MKTKLKNAKFLAAASALALMTGCSRGQSPAEGQNAMAGNIVGGKASTEKFQKENGIVALVIITEEGQGICTGTLIAPQLVLTAAHCIDGSRSPIKSVIAVFSNDVVTKEIKKEQARFGVKGAVHPDFLESALFGEESWSDIALVKLDAPAPADYKAARLPKSDNLTKPGTYLTQVGFGKTEALREVASDTSGVLRQVSGIKVLEKTSDGKELKLDEAKKGSCNGDSGGPAFVRERDGKFTLVGADSRGTLPDSCLGVGIYTNVGSHLEWIAKESKALMAAPTDLLAEAPAALPAPEPSAPSAD